MKNTILNFDKAEIDNFIVQDYSSKKVDIFSLKEVDEIKDNIVTISVDNNDTLEKISHRIYGSTDYWDILAILNDRDSIFGLSFDDDIVEIMAKRKYEKYISSFTDNIIFGDRLFNEILNEELSLNEEKRKLKIIHPSQIFKITTILRKQKFTQ